MKRTKNTYLVLLAVLLSPVAANADLITSRNFVSFTANESLYGGPPGEVSSATSSFSVPHLGSVSGTVSWQPGNIGSTADARFSATYSNTLSFEEANSASILINFLSDSSASFGSRYGVGLDLTATLLGFPYGLFSRTIGLATFARTTRPGLLSGLRLQDRDTLDTVGVGVGLGSFDVASANIFVEQITSLTFGSLVGTVEARHQRTGVTQFVDFALDNVATVGLDLQQSGFWDLRLLNLGLESTLITNFNLGISAQIGVLGVPVVRRELPFTLPFLEIDPHSLNYQTNRSPFIFGRINVAEEFVPPPPPPPPVSVPEPGTLALLGIGLLGMGLARRRKKA